eukprot:4932015-Pleurochrysis_carterae.AAC.1
MKCNPPLGAFCCGVAAPTGNLAFPGRLVSLERSEPLRERIMGAPSEVLSTPVSLLAFHTKR